MDAKAPMTETNLAYAIPPTTKSWFRTPHLLQLNICVGIVLISSTTMGFDGSMMNGLQSLDTWFTYFGSPDATWLGLMNAVLPLGVVSPMFREAVWQYSHKSRLSSLSQLVGCPMPLVGVTQ